MRNAVLCVVVMLAACGAGDRGKSERQDEPLDWSIAGPSIAEVDGQAVPRALFEGYLRLRGQADADPDGQRHTLDELIDLFILVRQAGREGLLDDSLKVELELQRLNTLGNRVYAEHARRHPVSDDEIAAEYARQIAAGGKREYQLRHILVSEETEARAIVQRLEQGAAFTALEVEYRDVVGGANSGSLGWVNLTQVPRSFGDALEAALAGRHVPSAVASEYGWHVIQVDAVREFSPPPLTEVAEGIRATLQGQRWERYVETLRTSASVRRDAQL